MEASTDLEKLADMGLRLSAVINTAIDGIFTIDTRGTVESVNPAGAKLFGYAQAEIIGHNISMLMPSPYKEQHDGYINRYMSTREPHIIGIGREVTGRRKDGSIFPLRLAVGEVKLQERTLFTGIIHDLTEVKKAEAEVHKLTEELELKVRDRTEELVETVNKLLHTNQRLEHEIRERKSAEKALRSALEKEKELSEMKSRFVSIASHQFRTPLSSILSSAELAEAYTQTDQQEKRQRHIDRIKSSVNSLISILNDILSLSQLEEGKVKIQPVKFVINNLCKEVRDEMLPLLKPGQQIRQHSETPMATVVLDKNLLKNILLNLLSNAIKYSKPNTNIDCNIELDENQLIIKIADQGMGIPLEDQPHLFTRFFRAHNVENIQGTGLGLNIVRRYVEDMDGTIDFESELGKGAVFIVKIPLVTSDW